MGLLIKIVRFKMKEMINSFEEVTCPSNFSSVLKNLYRCYWRFYEGCIKQDQEAMGGLADYIVVLDRIVSTNAG
jgi:hypothetical protein